MRELSIKWAIIITMSWNQIYFRTKFFRIHCLPRQNFLKCNFTFESEVKVRVIHESYVDLKVDWQGVCGRHCGWHESEDVLSRDGGCTEGLFPSVQSPHLQRKQLWTSARDTQNDNKKNWEGGFFWTLTRQECKICILLVVFMGRITIWLNNAT